MPKQVQCKAKAFYADEKTDGSTSDENARKLITKIKEDMSERGIPLNVGCLNPDELTATQVTVKTIELSHW